VSYCF